MTSPRPPEPPEGKRPSLGGRIRVRELSYVIRFCAFVGLAVLVTHLPPIRDHVIRPWPKVNAWLVGQVAGWITDDVKVHGAQIWSADTVFDVWWACTGAQGIILISAAIVAFPASLKRRLIAFPLCVLFLVILNVIRMSSLALIPVLVPRLAPTLMHVLHIYVWQALTVTAAFVLFAWFARGPRGDRGPETPAGGSLHGESLPCIDPPRIAGS